MSSILGRYINKTVRLGIPALFPEGPPCVAELLAVDSAGVWLESEGLTHAVYPHNPPESARVFIPFAQIAYILEEILESERSASPADQETPKEDAAPSKSKRSGHRGTPRNKHHR